MYGLAVMLTIPRRTTSKNFDKIIFNICFIHTSTYKVPSCNHQPLQTNQIRCYKQDKKIYFQVATQNLISICNKIYLY